MGTRPDLSFAVGLLGSFNANPSSRHIDMAYQVLRYIQGSKDLSLSMTANAQNAVGH